MAIATLDDEPPMESLAILIETALRKMVDTFSANDPIATSRLDADTLHDARVALRRMRSCLRTFRSIFDSGWAAGVRSDLSWFANLMGDVRQIDIVCEHLAAHEEWSAEDDGAQAILHCLDAERTRFLEHLDSEGHTPRYDVVCQHLETIRSRAPFNAKAGEQAQDALPRLLTAPWREVRGASKVARATQDETALHTLRIRAKELRYAADISRPVLGKPVAQVSRAASVVQDRLGNHRDAVFTAGYLAELGVTHPQGAFLAGQLAVLERNLAVTALQDFEQDLRRLRAQWRRVERNAK